jgi:hypothetical protein
LIDQEHVVDVAFGIVNVPSGVWIDEDGMIVRPAEPAWTASPDLDRIHIPNDASPDLVERINIVKALNYQGDVYTPALRDWVANGTGSRYALDADEVVRRSRPRPMAVSLAAANFEMGQQLHHLGYPSDAVAYFREAHRLQPENWTYKRGAWSLVDPAQGPSDLYEGDWLTDIKISGPENYYPALELEARPSPER